MRLLKLGIFLLFVLVAVLLVRTWQTPAIDLPVARAFAPLPLDADAALKRFAGAVRLHTVSTAEGPPGAEDYR